MRLKAHYMAVLTHFQRRSYDISSWFYTSVIKKYFSHFPSVYIGSKFPEISEHMKFMKIFYAPFFRWYFAIGVSRGPAFFYWRTDAGKVDLTDTLNTFVKHSENFVDIFEKRFQLKKWGIVKIF